MLELSDEPVLDQVWRPNGSVINNEPPSVFAKATSRQVGGIVFIEFIALRPKHVSKKEAPTVFYNCRSFMSRHRSGAQVALQQSLILQAIGSKIIGDIIEVKE